MAILESCARKGCLMQSLSCATRWRRALVLIAVVAGVFSPGRFAAEEPREYQVKAVLLYPLTQFVGWPITAFATPEAPFVIGILGNDPFDKTLDEVIHGEKASNRPIIIERYPKDKVEAAKKCHLLFVGMSERDNLRKIMAQLRDRPILTVSDSEGFIRSGGMIHLFKNSENKVRLRICLSVVKTNGLTVSSKLLRVAEIVRSEDD